MRRARGHLTGPFAFAGLVLLAGCGRPADAVPAAPLPAASAPARAPSAAAAAVATAVVQAPRASASSPVTEATCATAPLGVRVVAVRRESVDSIRVELAVTNLAPAGDWRPGSPAAASVKAAVEGLEGVSLLSADGRRRMFPLHGGSGQRVGAAAAIPVPGKPQTFWAVFPAPDGPVSLLLPGFAPLPGLVVAAPQARPEP